MTVDRRNIGRRKYHFVGIAEARVGYNYCREVYARIGIKLEYLFVGGEVGGQFNLLHYRLGRAADISALTFEAVLYPGVACAAGSAKFGCDCGCLLDGHIAVIDKVGKHIVAVKLGEWLEVEIKGKATACQKCADVYAVACSKLT